METNIIFTDWHEKYRCVVIDGTTTYVLGNWQEDKWVNCLKIADKGRVEKLVTIKPVMKGDTIKGVEIYE